MSDFFRSPQVGRFLHATVYGREHSNMAPEMPHPLWLLHFLPVTQLNIHLGVAVKGLWDVI